MKKLRIIALGTKCKDNATEFEGTLTHCEVDMDGGVYYLFQPRGLDPDTRMPLPKIVMEVGRLTGIEERNFVEVEFPTDKLGTLVTDSISTYTGMVVGIVLHLNGCQHYTLQAKGATKNGAPIGKIEADPRSCGEVLPPTAPVSPGDPFLESTVGAS